MELPAGTHTVEWRFRAPGWNVAEGVTLASSLAILAGIIATVILVLRHERRQRLKRKVRNSYIVSNISIALVLFLLGSVGYLMTAAMQVARTLQESVTVTVELRNGADEKQKNRSANGSKPTSW